MAPAPTQDLASTATPSPSSVWDAAANGASPSAQDADVRNRRRARLAGIVLLVAAAILYAATLDTGLASGELVGGDLITHQYAQVQARPSNAPGYPLYTMGGWLWFRGGRELAGALGSNTPNPLPILSSYSTFWALAALWLLYELVRLITSSRYRPQSRHGVAGNWPLALLISAFYGVTFFFWYYATTTEQYTSAVAQSLAIVLVYLHWSAADRAAGDDGYGLQSRPGLMLVALAFLNGLSLAHMLTVALIVPPLVVAILWQRPSLLRRGALLVAVVAAAALPLASYLYVWLRGSTHPEWWGAGDWETAREWFLAFVSTAQGRDELSWGLEAGRPLFGGDFPALIWRELSLPLLLVGLWGIALLRRTTAIVLYGTLLLYAAFCWVYRFGNWYQVVLPAYPLILLGVATAADRLLERTITQRRRWLHASVWAALFLALVWRVTASLPDADSRGRPGDLALPQAAARMASAPPNAALFASVEEALALDYLISIWGLRPDLALATTINAGDALEDGRPLVSTWEAAPTLLSELPSALPAEIRAASPLAPLRVAAVGPDWVQILPAGGAQLPPPPAYPFDAAKQADHSLLDGALVLEGWAALPAPNGSPAGSVSPALDIWLAWHLPQGWPAGVSLSIRPTLGGEQLALPGNPEGAIVQADISVPLRGLLPSVADPSRMVETLRLPLPAPLPGAADGLALILYRPDGSGGFEVLDELRLPFTAE